MQKIRLLLIPGLGYDCRIFQNLNFDQYEKIRINWIEPKKNENLRAYSKRLIADLPSSASKTIIIGHSMGGIVAQEIATFFPVFKIILISSIQSRDELPGFFKLMGFLKLYYLFNKTIAISTLKYWGKYHGLGQKNMQSLFKDMISHHSNNYLHWALENLCHWHPHHSKTSQNIVQIHGTEDKTFPYQLIEQPTYTIKDGTHLMVLHHSDRISSIILQEFQTKE